MSNEEGRGPWKGIAIAAAAAIVLAMVVALTSNGCGKRDAGNGSAVTTPGGTGQTSATPPTALYGGATRNITDNAFHFAVGGQPAECDPQLITSVIEFNIIENVCEGLFAWGPRGPSDVRPGVAERYDVSPDGKTYTFHLRANARWSNGDPITAVDFVWSWERFRAPATHAQYAFLMQEAKIASFRAVNAQTLTVTLSEPNGIFMNVVPFKPFCPVHRPTIDAHGAAWCQPTTWVGNGPFVPVEARVDDYVKLRKNPRYWNVGSVALEEVFAYTANNNELHMNRYKKGFLDWTGETSRIPPADLDQIRDPNDPARFTASDVVAYARLANAHVSVHVQRRGLNDARIRRALSLAIDREKIARHITRGNEIPSGNFIPPIGAYDPPPADEYTSTTTASCDAGRQLLIAAGHPGGTGLPTYRFLYRTNNPVEQKVAVAIQQMWKDCLGVQTDLSGSPMDLWQERVLKQHDYDLTMDGWQGDFPHPQTFAGLLSSTSDMNHTEYRSSGYDGVMATGIREQDDARIEAIYNNLERIIRRDAPVIPIFFSPRIHAVRPEWNGIEPNVMMSHPLQYVRRK